MGKIKSDVQMIKETNLDSIEFNLTEILQQRGEVTNLYNRMGISINHLEKLWTTDDTLETIIGKIRVLSCDIRRACDVIDVCFDQLREHEAIDAKGRADK